MNVRLKPDRLCAEIAIRGLDHAEFARVAGISAATLSHSVHGRAVSEATLRRIAGALTSLPGLPGASELVA